MNSNSCEGYAVRRHKCCNLVQKAVTLFCSWCWNEFNKDHGDVMRP